MSTTIRITNPTQQGGRLSWGNDLFQRCGNAVELEQAETFEALPVPDVNESEDWQQWDAAVSDLDLFRAAQGAAS